MRVQKAMHNGASSVTPETPIKKIVAIMKKEDIGAVPVAKDQKVVGMVTDRDLALRALADSAEPAKLTAADVMTKNVASCRSDQTVEDAIHLMQQKKIRRLPVIDSDDHLVGMLSLSDISHHASREKSASLIQAVATPH